MQMVLSVIIPVYNEEATILEILSVLQNISLPNEINKEIIIVNDCSSDNTLNLIDCYMKNNTSLNIYIQLREIANTLIIKFCY